MRLRYFRYSVWILIPLALSIPERIKSSTFSVGFKQMILPIDKAMDFLNDGGYDLDYDEFNLPKLDDMDAILDNNIQNTRFEITKYITNDDAPLEIKYDINFDEIITLPKTLELKQNYPNPFNALTTINFGLPEADEVSLTIFNILGEKVKTIYEKQPINAGYHKVIWSGDNQNGNFVSSGLYFCELLFKKDRKLIKMVYVR